MVGMMIFSPEELDIFSATTWPGDDDDEQKALLLDQSPGW